MPFTEDNRHQLETLGWTIVPGLVSESDCDRHLAYFKNWLSKFKAFPTSWANSWIGRYKAGHLEPVWEVRLAAKDTFAKIWRTQRLLTSMDAIAIGRPPEDSEELFSSPKLIKFRSDQTAEREGLHAYQGMVFLEHCLTDDWTYEVIEGSHLLYDQFMSDTRQWQCYDLDPKHISWLEQKGCSRRRLAIPKGGLLLCDARLFKTHVRPIEGRANPGRWLYLVHVCMTPAVWATEADLALKKKAYDSMLMTSHWPSQKIIVWDSKNLKDKKGPGDPWSELTMPDVARTPEARRLAGVEAYQGLDDESEDDVVFFPTWDEDKWGEEIDEFKFSQMACSKLKVKDIAEDDDRVLEKGRKKYK